MDAVSRIMLKLAACALLAAAASFAALAQQDVQPASQLSGPALLDALRKGGFVLYFRHTSTDFGQNDDRMTGYEDCSVQRNLTDNGRDEARAIGRAIEALRIPVGDVLASPFCRTMETGRLIFGRATATPAVRGGPPNNDGDRYRDLRRLLAQPVPPGSNVAITSHGNPYQAVVGPPYLAEGEAAVIRPLPPDRFSVVARIPKDAWTALSLP